jgi:hypothetical protein
MGERLQVEVSYNPAIGYVTQACPRVPRSLHALSLEGLRRQIVASFLLRWRKRDQAIAVHFALDDAARTEVLRRQR